MDRPAPDPGRVRAEPPPPLTALPAEPEPPSPRPRPRIGIGWRIALFAWVTAFGFLAAYELLSAIFRLIRR